MRTNVDVSMYVGEQKASRIKPEEIDMTDLPPIEKQQPSSENTHRGPVPLSTSQTPLPAQEKTERNPERTDNRADYRTENRTVLPVKRQTKRYSFEFYVDQLTSLKRLKNHVEEKGENISLSDIVRQALDYYLKEQGE